MRLTSHSTRFAVLLCLTLLLMISPLSLRAVDFTIDSPTPYTVADGLCGLIEAIDNANADAVIHADCPAGAGADTLTLTADVVLDAAVTFNANGPTGLPSITSEIVIAGEGFGIYRAPTAPEFRILHVGALGDLTVQRTIIDGGLLATGFTDGGGIYVAGALTLTSSTVQNNTNAGIFPSGGGIYGTAASVITLTDTIVQNNVADNGDPGAVFDYGGGIYTFGELTLTSATIRANRAAELAGGVFAGDATVIQDSVIADNVALDAGGLLSFGTIDPTPFTIDSTVFSGNIAIGGGDGGGAMLNGRDGITINASTFVNNTLQGAGVGGAIANSLGVMDITASIFEGNRTLAGSFGGGAISNITLGEVNLRGSIVRNNSTTARGGGLFTQLAEFNVFDSLIDGNTATLGGGGFYAAPSNVPSFTVQRSTISNNFTESFGGGFLAEGNLSESTFINSTFTGNRATVLGGAVGLNQGGVVNLIHTTIADNDTTQFNNGIGGANMFAGTGTLTGTIIANNPTGDCSATTGSTSFGYNVSTAPDGGIPPDRWCAFIPLDPTDLPETDPLLAPVATNGNIGVSYTLQPGSPAIDIVPMDCPPELEGVDQRGVPRPAGTCDAGSVASVDAVLPLVYFSTPATVFDNEATATDTQTIELVVDNTAGTFAMPTTTPLTVYIVQASTSANTLDYTTTLVPIFTFDAGNFPVPGTQQVIPFDVTVLDDLIREGDEFVALSLIVTGPGRLDDTRDSHLITIVDDEPPPADVVITPPIDDTTDADGVAVASAGNFSASISKIGFVRPGNVVEWVITVSNDGTSPGTNVVVSDTLPAGFRVDGVASDGAVSASGGTVTVSLGDLPPGATVQLTITTVAEDGLRIAPNTACVDADNVTGAVCATALPISTLPATGESPPWREALLRLLMLNDYFTPR